MIRVATWMSVCLCAVPSGIYLTAPLFRDASWITAVTLAFIGVVGATAGLVVHRWPWISFVLSLIYLALVVMPPTLITTLHWYGPSAALLVSLSLFRLFRGSTRP